MNRVSWKQYTILRIFLLTTLVALSVAVEFYDRLDRAGY